jgi:hypothetical protein
VVFTATAGHARYSAYSLPVLQIRWCLQHQLEMVLDDARYCAGFVQHFGFDLEQLQELL